MTGGGEVDGDDVDGKYEAENAHGALLSEGGGQTRNGRRDEARAA
jgi:hypothetical protein